MAAKRAQKGNAKPQSKSPEVKRDAKGRLAKGSSGNPGGLPKWRRDLAEALKASAQAAANLLDEVISDDNADMQHRIQAAAVALRYTVPAPKQKVEVSGGVSLDLTREELRAIATLSVD